MTDHSRRPDTRQSPENPEPMEQDVDDILAIYTQNEDSGQYQASARAEGDDDMMRDYEPGEGVPSETIGLEHNQDLQQKEVQESNDDFHPQPDNVQDLIEAGGTGQAVEQERQQQEQDGRSEYEDEEVRPGLSGRREHAETEHYQDEDLLFDSEGTPLEDSEESGQDLQQRSAPGFEAQPEEERGEHDNHDDAEDRDQARELDRPELQRAPERNTFQRIQDLISSNIDDLENGQVSDEAGGLDSTLTDHQSLTHDDEVLQVGKRHVSGIENQNPSPVSTPAGSPRLAVFPEENVADGTSLGEDSQPTLARPAPVAAPVPRSPRPDKIRINMKVKRHGAWRDMQPIMVDPNNTADFERRVNRYIRDGLQPLSTRLGMLPTRHCFALITDDQTNMILFLPDGEIVLDDETLENATRFHADAVAGATFERKRAAEDDLSRNYHAQKIPRWG